LILYYFPNTIQIILEISSIAFSIRVNAVKYFLFIQTRIIRFQYYTFLMSQQYFTTYNNFWYIKWFTHRKDNLEKVSVRFEKPNLR